MTTSSSGNYTMQDTSKVSLKGTAVVSGAQYIGEDEFSFSNTGQLPTPGQRTEFSVIRTVLMIRQGETLPNDDFYTFVRMHMTIDANGVPTADFSILNTQCK